jgi:hypothetical protein
MMTAAAMPLLIKENFEEKRKCPSCNFFKKRKKNVCSTEEKKKKFL